jgi:hypothetical protein
MKPIQTGHEIHRGACDCVRVAFHVVDKATNALEGLSYDEEGAKRLARKISLKNPGMQFSIQRRNVFTLARHVDDQGRMS